MSSVVRLVGVFALGATLSVTLEGCTATEMRPTRHPRQSVSSEGCHGRETVFDGAIALSAAGVPRATVRWRCSYDRDSATGRVYFGTRGVTAHSGRVVTGPLVCVFVGEPGQDLFERAHVERCFDQELLFTDWSWGVAEKLVVFGIRNDGSIGALFETLARDGYDFIDVTNDGRPDIVTCTNDGGDTPREACVYSWDSSLQSFRLVGRWRVRECGRFELAGAGGRIESGNE